MMKKATNTQKEKNIDSNIQNSNINNPSVINTNSFWGRFLEKNEIKNILFIIAIGLILRIVFIAETAGIPFFRHLVSDSKIYNDWALGIAGKGNWNSPGSFFMAPFYPYFMGIIYMIFGESITLVRVLQALISTANIFIIYLTGRRLINKNAGYIAASIAALYKLYIFYSGIILSETLQTFAVSLLVLLLVTASADLKDNKKHISKWIWAGVLLGVSAIFRANILLFLPFIAIWFLIIIKENPHIKNYAYKALLFFLLGTLIPILPVTLKNLVSGKEFVLLTSNGGINFYLGNNPDSPGVFQTPEEFDFSSDLSGQRYAEKITGRKLTPAEASSFWYKRGTDYISQDPGGAFLLTVKKFLLFWGGEENPQSFIMNPDYFSSNFSKVLQLPLTSFLFVSLLAIAGIILSWKEKGKFSVLYLFTAAYILSTVIFFVNGRFRLALTPLLIIFASYSITATFEKLKSSEYRALKAPAVTAALFIIIYTFFVPKPVYNDYDAYLSMGNIYFDEKQYEKAIESYGKSLIYRDHFTTYVNIANAYSAKKDFRSALTAYQKAINRNPNYPLAYFNIGLIHSETGNLQMAQKAFNKTLELDSQFADAYRNLGIIYYLQQDYAMSYENFQSYLKYSNDETTKASVIKDMENMRKYLK